MIIVNQDKNEIINFDNVINIGITDCGEEGYLIAAGFIVGRDDNYRDLGYYKTEERAKEVLYKIAASYIDDNIFMMPKFNFSKSLDAKQISKILCFQMPEE